MNIRQMQKKNLRDLRKLERKDPLLMIVIVLIFLSLTVFVVFPIIKVFQISLTSTEGSGLTFDHFKETFRSTGFSKIFTNSMKLAVISAIFATILGYLFAYATTRVKLPGKKVFKLLAILPIISPPFVLSLSMIFLFGRQGMITKNLLGILDADVYGLKSLVVVQVMSFFPVAYLTLRGILASIDPSVEDAAYNMGASRFYIFRTVTLPLSVPGIASALLLVFIQSLEDFSNPAVIAGKYDTLAVEAYRVITGMNNLPVGAILSISLLLPIMLAFLLQKYWLSGKSYVTVTGKPQHDRDLLSDKKVVVPFFIVCVLISAVIILFYGTVLTGAFVKVWGINYSFTLDHFRYVFSLGWDTIKNSLILVTFATIVSGIMAMVIAFIVVRKRFLGRAYIEFTSMLMFAIPGTVVGIGYILAFNSKPLILTGTALIIIIALIFRNMPVGIESGISTLMQIDPSIEEAATILGSSSFYTFRKITLPLIRQAFFSGLVFSFVKGMTAVSSIIFLISARWHLATTKIFALFEDSKYSDAAAYIILMIVIILIAIGVLSMLTNMLDPKRKKRR